MRVVAIIQGRMTSQRLPGKTLADIAGTPQLGHVVARAREAGVFKTVIVATSVDPTDDSIEAYCGAQNIPCFRGDLDDVLDRYAQAAAAHEADVITRLTADCPMLDPDVIRKIVEAFDPEQHDYVSNTLPRTYPKGLDTEVFSREALVKTATQARSTSEREHVTPYMHNAKIFRIGQITQTPDRSALRWTVDTPEDLAFVRAVYAELGSRIFGQEEILALLQRRPDIQNIHANIAQ
jgi:spore coat polysaccharide biosynthesis protein SpsF